jgi:hypothetical protein
VHSRTLAQATAHALCNHQEVIADSERLSALWDERWPSTPPIAFLLRVRHPDRWVRFHSLPESKRYAETESEMAEILTRHHAVLGALGVSDQCLVILTRFASDTPPGIELPDESHWRTIEADEYLEEPARLCVSLMTYGSDAFDAVLRAAAEWQIANVIVGPSDLRWLYHPYDGGADVIASSPEERDRLRADFSDWLSSHPRGV